MKKIIFLSFIFLSLNAIAQNQKALADYTIAELDQKKKEAVAKENLTDAATYKKAIDLKTQIDAAIKVEDYTKAATLKQQLKTLKVDGTSNVDKNKKLEEDIKKAIAAEDYTKAAALKKQLESGKVTTKAVDNSPVVMAMPMVEFTNQVYAWNKTDNSVKPLEYDTPIIKTQAKVGYGYSEATSFWTISGTKSDVMINANTSFILKVADGVNPADMFRLVKFQILGKKEPCRHMAAYKSTSAAYAGTSTSEKRDFDMPVTYSKLDDGCYEIVVNGRLSPGEYTFYGLGKMYSFSLNDVLSNNFETKKNTSENSDYYNGNSATPASTTSYTRSDIYKEPNITWFGVDFSLFTFTFSKKMGQENQLLEKINSWQRRYENEITPLKLKAWFNKISFAAEKEYSESLYRTNLKQTWISNDFRGVSSAEIQEHLKNYKSNGRGIGMVLIPESFNEDRDNFTIEFVWFDIDTKAIIHSQQLNGRGHGGASLAGWGDALIEATKSYVDKYYKKEKKGY